MGQAKKKKVVNKDLPKKLSPRAMKFDKPVMRIEQLSAIDRHGFVRAIIESPKGSRNKYDYEPESGMFECGAALKGGMTFPFDFGFIPSTKAQDGDPLDVIILMDEPAFAGCLVHTRIIGVLEAEQTEEGNTFRNDRLIGVHTGSVDYGNTQRWQDLPKTMRDETEEFFVYYNQSRGKIFKPLRWRGAKTAYKLLNQHLIAKVEKRPA